MPCLALGQLDGVLACCVFVGLPQAAVRPALAGLLLGVEVLKPQTGLIAPIALLAAGRWRALVAGAVTVLALFLLPVACFGWTSWALYLHAGSALARGLLQANFGLSYQLNGISVFWMGRSLGGSVTVAYAAQALAGLMAIGIVWRAWRLPGADRLAVAALTMLLTLFLTPYGYSSDMVGYTLALAVLAAWRGWRVSLLDGLLWLWPGFIVLFTMTTGVLLTPLVVALASFRAWRAVRP